MKNHTIPNTTTRVEEATAPHINERNQQDMAQRVASYRDASEAHITQRLEELEREWDMERTLELNASAAILLTLTLGKTVNKSWYALSAVVAGFLFQHAVQGWCPPVPLLRRFGVRTAREIGEEKQALLAMRKSLHLRNPGYKPVRD